MSLKSTFYICTRSVLVFANIWVLRLVRFSSVYFSSPKFLGNQMINHINTTTLWNNHKTAMNRKMMKYCQSMVPTLSKKCKELKFWIILSCFDFFCNAQKNWRTFFWIILINSDFDRIIVVFLFCILIEPYCVCQPLESKPI
jgi:hypothetical protein